MANQVLTPEVSSLKHHSLLPPSCVVQISPTAEPDDSRRGQKERHLEAGDGALYPKHMPGFGDRPAARAAQSSHWAPSFFPRGTRQGGTAIRDMDPLSDGPTPNWAQHSSHGFFLVNE